MTITIYQIPDAAAYPWHWQITTPAGKPIAGGWHATEQDAIDAAHATMSAIADGDA